MYTSNRQKELSRNSIMQLWLLLSYFFSSCLIVPINSLRLLRDKQPYLSSLSLLISCLTPLTPRDPAYPNIGDPANSLIKEVINWNHAIEITGSVEIFCNRTTRNQNFLNSFISAELWHSGYFLFCFFNYINSDGAQTVFRFAQSYYVVCSIE